MSDSYQLSRRKFLATGSCGAMGIGSLVNTLAQLQLINSAAAASGPGGSDVVGDDYKALVCIFLRGGCDMNNVLIPVAGNPQAAGYTADRNVVGVRNGVVDSVLNPAGENDTLPLTAAGDPFGLHPSLVNLQTMFNANEAAFVSNVGTLAEPTTPTTYTSASLPRQLFSHSDQVTEWMSSIADQPYRSGWGARVADLYHANWNPQSQTSMLITAAGNNQFLNGGSLAQYSVTSAGAISLAGFSSGGTPYGGALEGDGSYRTNSTGNRLKALERIMAYSHANILEDGYNTVVERARDNEAIVTEASEVATGLGLDLDALFENADSSIGDELKAIAKLIAGRKCLGNKRQIFFVDYGGFDNHQDINADLGGLLSNLDNAIGAFNEALKALALVDSDFAYDKVTTFQASDFNRTWTPNSADPTTAGTDHAWGTHTFLFGGAVNGGQIYGTFPELAVGGLVDVPSGSRGRWIPTTAVDQYCAVLANWFGVPAASTQMGVILPNLDRFADPFSAGSGLNFL
ncbi:DUF1501 domain-containing protein [Roseibacillus persicicus]|uniref:DUF1501 domain-containing protein n=1 Tax=Roseibacillus persicicus TaxID=454148 RepID=A0A918TSV6_9BACT|nr:DUF1501 domain-containing protein [Roseibacillus persicicus]GHC55166.1 hypothetical protein GCM10007100_22110 [Roseibacillus persicicus]